MRGGKSFGADEDAMCAFRGIDRRGFLKAGAILCGGILADAVSGTIGVCRAAQRVPCPGFSGKPLRTDLWIRSGDTVLIDTGTCPADGMVQGTRTEEWIRRYIEEMARRPRTRILPAPGAGPIFVKDAGPGDILQMEILEIIPASFGFHFRPGLSDTESGPLAIASGVRAKWYRTNLCPYEFGFSPEVRIPVRPFAGSLGIAPAGLSENLGCRELTAGTALYVPVREKGAGVTAGNPLLPEEPGTEDPGARDGISRAMALRLSIRKDLEGIIPGPLISSPAHWIFLAAHSRPGEAGRAASEDAARFLGDRHGTSPEESRRYICMRAERCIERRGDGTYIARVRISKQVSGNTL